MMMMMRQGRMGWGMRVKMLNGLDDEDDYYDDDDCGDDDDNDQLHQSRHVSDHLPLQHLKHHHVDDGARGDALRMKTTYNFLSLHLSWACLVPGILKLSSGSQCWTAQRLPSQCQCPSD